jgi:SMI1-KNR4 cell-wall
MNQNQRATIWQVPAYLPYRQPKLTAEALAMAEKRIGYKLPTAYIDLLQVQNGGYIRFTGLNGLNRVMYGIGPYFPNIEDNDWSPYDGDLTIELEGLAPFDGDGHWHLCLDYRKSKDHPQVTYIDTETDQEESIAASFGEYSTALPGTAANDATAQGRRKGHHRAVKADFG